MRGITLKKENIKAVMTFKENDPAQIAVLNGYIADKRMAFTDPEREIHSLIFYADGKDTICYAVSSGVRSLLPKLQKGLYLNI
ncbi:MAG: hypothetical protein LBT30_04165 [Clostridiales bacterium]|jgi:hypothetical protein|nr:hypothetical protein [Clostridiales bacterium]